MRVYVCVCVCVCEIKKNRHFICPYSILDPFKSSNESLDFWMEGILEEKDKEQVGEQFTKEK